MNSHPVLASTNQSLHLLSQIPHSLRLLEQISTLPQKFKPTQIYRLHQNPQISRLLATSNTPTRTTRNKLPTKEIKLLRFSTSKFIFHVSKILLMKSLNLTFSPIPTKLLHHKQNYNHNVLAHHFPVNP